MSIMKGKSKTNDQLTHKRKLTESNFSPDKSSRDARNSKENAQYDREYF